MQVCTTGDGKSGLFFERWGGGPNINMTLYVSDDTGFQIVYGDSVISVKAATVSMKKQWMTRISQASSVLSASRR